MFCFPNKGHLIISRELFFQIMPLKVAYLSIIYGNAKAQVPLIPLWGEQNIQAKDAYGFIIRSI